MEGCLTVELDDKTCQSCQGQGVVARIDRGHIRQQFRLSCKPHTRRVHNAADQRTVDFQMCTNQDVVERSTYEGRAGDCLYMQVAEEEVALTEHLGYKSLNLDVLAVFDTEIFRFHLHRGHPDAVRSWPSR